MVDYKSVLNVIMLNYIGESISIPVELMISKKNRMQYLFWWQIPISTSPVSSLSSSLAITPKFITMMKQSIYKRCYHKYAIFQDQWAGKAGTRLMRSKGIRKGAETRAGSERCLSLPYNRWIPIKHTGTPCQLKGPSSTQLPSTRLTGLLTLSIYINHTVP